MAKKKSRSKLYQLISSKRMRDRLHPRVEKKDRVDEDGTRRLLRHDEFTADGFPWGGRNVGELL